MSSSSSSSSRPSILQGDGGMQVLTRFLIKNIVLFEFFRNFSTFRMALNAFAPTFILGSAMPLLPFSARSFARSNGMLEILFETW